MKKNLVPLLGIAFVVAIISTAVFYWLFVGKIKSGGPAGQSVVVAARNLDRGTVLQAADVKFVPWGATVLPQGAFTAADAANGLTLVASQQENEPVLASHVASKSGSGAGMGIPSGMRAISVHTSDSSGIIGMLRSGYKVDVQFVSAEGELRTILQNIEVLTVNPAGDNRSLVPVVTLLVDPEGADKAGLGDSTARLRITLRNPLDDGAPDSRTVTAPAIMQRTGGKK
jgi:Flp pilus assembly protein CpaB